MKFKQSPIKLKAIIIADHTRDVALFGDIISRDVTAHTPANRPFYVYWRRSM